MRGEQATDFMTISFVDLICDGFIAFTQWLSGCCRVRHVANTCEESATATKS